MKAILAVLFGMLVAALPQPAAQARTLSPATVGLFLEKAAQCTGTWHASTDDGFVTVTAQEHLPQAEWFARSPNALEQAQARAIYDFAKGMVSPGFADYPDGIFDPKGMMECPEDAALGLQILRWLVGEQRGDLAGPSNSYSWLAAAYDAGIGVPQDRAAARLWWLKMRITFGLPKADAWGDGIDDDIYANIERAGLLDFLTADAEFANGDAARRIFAEHYIRSDPERARSYLGDYHPLTAQMRLDFEAEDWLPLRYDEEEVAYWTEIARRRPSDDRWRIKTEEVITGAAGARIKLSPRSPSFAELFGGSPPTHAPRGGFDQTPVALRVLVDSKGDALLLSACAWTEGRSFATWKSPAFREIWRMYSDAELEGLPSPASGQQFHWVALPVVSLSTGRPAEIRLPSPSGIDCAH